MRRDDDLQPAVMIEEWLLVLRGPADLDPTTVAAVRRQVREALEQLVRELAGPLRQTEVQLELSTE